jgi:hypothetical protein
MVVDDLSIWSIKSMTQLDEQETSGRGNADNLNHAFGIYDAFLCMLAGNGQ